MTPLDQPSRLPSTSPKTSRNSARPEGHGATPVQGLRPPAADSGRRQSASTTMATPRGTLTRKIEGQPKASVSKPPTSGPTANPLPMAAPQMPKARPSSAPRNS